MASVAQWEAQIIGERTRVALAERQAAGVTLGRPRSVDAGTVQVINFSAWRWMGAVRGVLRRS